jgi:hypothetical protein
MWTGWDENNRRPVSQLWATTLRKLSYHESAGSAKWILDSGGREGREQPHRLIFSARYFLVPQKLWLV